MTLDPVLASSLAPESSPSTKIPNNFIASSITERLLGEGDRPQRKERWGQAALLELESLARETDPEIFGTDLLRLGLRLERKNRLDLAGQIYSAVTALGGDAAERAQRQSNAILGVGAIGPRAEFLSRRLFEEATRPEMLLAMGVAGLTFRLTRLAISCNAAGSLSGLGLRAAANAGGFLAETAAFTGTAKLGAAALGNAQDWSPKAIGQEWAGAAVMLSGLKLLGGAAIAAQSRWVLGSGGLQAFTRAAAPQALMLGGVYLGHRLEEALGFRPRQDGATAWTDALATLFQFNIAGRLLQSASGGRLERLERRLDWQNQSRPGGSDLPFSPELSFAGSGTLPAGLRLTSISSPGYEHIVLMSDDKPGGKIFPRPTITRDLSRGPLPRTISGQLPSPSEVAAELQRLHGAWLKGGGEILLNGRKVAPQEVNLDELQEAIWAQQRPVIVGHEGFVSSHWGRLAPVFRNLNNPGELYKRELGHANYLLALSIVAGRPFESLALPSTAAMEAPQYPISPYELVSLRQQLTGLKEGLLLPRQEIIDRFFAGNARLADAAIPFVLDRPSMERRGWGVDSSAAAFSSESASVGQSMGPAPASERRKTLYDLTLHDLRGIIPEGGGPPLNNHALTEAVEQGAFEHLLNDGHCIGWWTRLPRQGAYQANIIGKVHEFDPQSIYNLLSNREEWTTFYPGFYLVERVRPLSTDQSVYRLALKTPAGKIRMFSKQTTLPAKSQLQVRWEDPSPEQVRDLEIGTELNENVVARIQGSITVAPVSMGTRNPQEGSLLLYELFMTTRQTGKAGEIDPFVDLRRGEHATMARVPPLLSSIYAKLAANRDGGEWGVQDPSKLAEYRESRDLMKGPAPAKYVYHPRVWVVDK